MGVGSDTRELGPADGTLLVRTFREGMAAKAGHDLVIEVTAWSARVRLDADPARATVELQADPRSLRVREGAGGVKPLTDGDRAEIERTIDAKVLRGSAIGFRSTSVRRDTGGGALTVAGELTIGDASRPLEARLDVHPDGRVDGSIPLTQSEWGIKPYRGMLGALKVRDELRIEIDVRTA